VIKVLFFASNPAGSNPLKLVQEVNEIRSKLRASGGHIELIDRHGAGVDMIIDELNREEPEIVHFSGHGSPQNELVLYGPNDTTQLVSKESLGQLFGAFPGQTRVVLLNACYSKGQAEIIRQHVDCVIGMNDEIKDSAATNFSAAFYSALGFGKDVQAAYDQARVAVSMKQSDDPEIIELLARPGVDPKSIQFKDEAELPDTAKLPINLRRTLLFLVIACIIGATLFAIFRSPTYTPRKLDLDSVTKMIAEDLCATQNVEFSRSTLVVEGLRAVELTLTKDAGTSVIKASRNHQPEDCVKIEVEFTFRGDFSKQEFHAGCDIIIQGRITRLESDKHTNTMVYVDFSGCRAERTAKP